MIKKYKYEIYKLTKFVPLVIILPISVFLNIFLIIKDKNNNAYIQLEFKYAHSIQKEYGVYMDENFCKEYLDKMIVADSAEFTDIYLHYIGNDPDYSSAEKILDQIETVLDVIKKDEKTEAKRNLEKVNVFKNKINSYINEIEKPEKIYIDYLTEHTDYKKRIDEIINSGETKYFFISNSKTDFYYFLFNKLFFLCLSEITILAALSVSYLIGYEKENKTDNLAHTSKTGNNIYVIKLLACLTVSLVIFFLIMACSLAVFFFEYDFSDFWNVKLCNYYFSKDGIPLITWFSLTFRELVVKYVILSFLIEITFVLIFFIISKAVSNKFISFSLCILPCAVCFINNQVDFSKFFLSFIYSTPFMIIKNCGNWFLMNYSNNFTPPFPEYELICTVMWITICLFIILIQTYGLKPFTNHKRFTKRKD